MRHRGTPVGAAVDVTEVSGLAAGPFNPWPTLFPRAKLDNLRSPNCASHSATSRTESAI